MCLAFINRTTQQWQRESDVTLVNGVFQAYTSHFTEFAVVVGVRAPTVNLIDYSDFLLLEDVDESKVGLCIQLVKFIIYC